MSRVAATAIVLVLYALHQDIWFWHVATPIVFGVLPIGLFYHVAYTVITAVVMAVLVSRCWPAHLEHEMPDVPHAATRDGSTDPATRHSPR